MKRVTIVLVALTSAASFFMHAANPLGAVYHTVDQWARWSTRPIATVVSPKNTQYIVADDMAVMSVAQQRALEYGAILNRCNRVHAAQEALFQATKPATISLCLSGGSYRAMIVALASLRALEEIGLLDTITYMSALSGSTWAVSAWLALGGSLAQTADALRETLANNPAVPLFGVGLPSVPGLPAWKAMVASVATKWAYNQPVTLIDFYGATIANDLLSGHPERLSLRFSDFRYPIEQGDVPFTLFSAVSPTCTSDFWWFDYSPYTIGSTELGWYVDTRVFGREFYAGVSRAECRAPELPLSYHLGTFGSAFGITYEQVITDYLLKRSVIDRLLDQRVSTGRVNNPVYGLVGDDLADEKCLDLIDAGLSFGVPVPPLLDRSSDVIIIVDACSYESGTEGDSLVKAAQHAHQRGQLFPVVDAEQLRAQILANKTLIIYPQAAHERVPGMPLVLYFPLRNDGTRPDLADFDVASCIQREFCATFNLAYRPDEFDKLYDLAYYNIAAHEDTVKNAIKAVIAVC